MTPHGIPVIKPIPYLNGDPMGPGAAQPILQFKELERDIIRWQDYQVWLAKEHAAGRKVTAFEERWGEDPGAS